MIVTINLILLLDVPTYIYILLRRPRKTTTATEYYHLYYILYTERVESARAQTGCAYDYSFFSCRLTYRYGTSIRVGDEGLV